MKVKSIENEDMIMAMTMTKAIITKTEKLRFYLNSKTSKCH